MPDPFDDRARRYLEKFGDRYSLNQSSGLYQPYPEPSPEPPRPNQTHETPSQQVCRDRHHPLRVAVQRDWVPMIISALTLILLCFTVRYTFKQWLEANRSANASEIAAHAAQSAAVTANHTLNEMKTEAQNTLSTNKQATNLDQRAWVGLSRLEAIPTDTGHVIKGFAINSGKTPANDVRAAVGVYARYAPALPYTPNEGDYDWIRYILKKTWNKEIEQTTYLVSHVPFDPRYNGRKPPNLQFRDWVGAPRLKGMGVLPPGNNPYDIPFPDVLLTTGGAYFTLIFYGEIRYKDFIGKEQLTQFCYLVPRETGKAAPLIPCEKFNEMK
jgi:hypothetical protein